MNESYTLRFFNSEGSNKFERILNEIKQGGKENINSEFLLDNTFSMEFEPNILIEKTRFANKNELIPYIVDRLGLRSNKHLYFNKGIWTWLAALYFENICPSDANGNRKISENAFYILRDPSNYRKYYRHLLAYPCRLFSELGDSAKIFLIGTFKRRGEITEQFGAYQEIALNKGILDAANLLYWNEQSKNLKKGAAGKGAGSARRLIRLIRQYQMTFDLNSMNGDEIVNLLPLEFNKWK